MIWEGAELWPRYRAREHELILAPWSPDYVDPHSNADAFARNPDNRPEANLTGVLAWRNAWAGDILVVPLPCDQSPAPGRARRPRPDRLSRLRSPRVGTRRANPHGTHHPVQ